MINVGVKELRNRLKYYMDKLEQGEEITIIRQSTVIGRIIPANEAGTGRQSRQSPQLDTAFKIADNQEVKFRQPGEYEDPRAVQQLHRAALEAAGAYIDNPSLDSDLNAPASYYEKMNGEFWVGELQGQIVAMGAFALHLQADTNNEAELKRMRVRPDLQGQGIGGRLLEILENRARQKGYASAMLDVTSADNQQPARHFYQHHGYTEIRREAGQQVDVIYCRKVL